MDGFQGNLMISTTNRCLGSESSGLQLLDCVAAQDDQTWEWTGAVGTSALRNKRAGMCLNAPANQPDGTLMSLWDCEDMYTSSQTWNMGAQLATQQHVATGQTMALMNPASGKCLDVVNTNAITLWTCNHDPLQAWQWMDGFQGNLMVTMTNRCLGSE